LDAVMLLPINKIMITNVNPAIIQESLWFYPIQVISYLNNPNKNNPQFYNQLLKDINVAAQDCFMFDSKQENLDAASANGIEWILYINNEQMIPILQQKFSS
jgi:HAD superfamily hydrolase (TIGR01509 family)